jgi:hypothetical protein
MSRTTAKIDIDATSIDALHHGAGVSGNTQMLRVQEVVLADGTPGRVPFVSGNSIKHMVRDGAVRFALDAMGVEDGSLTKPVVNLLFAGGTLSKGGGSTDLSQARRLADLFPALSLCGYAAGNFMEGSKVRVDNLHLVCAENAWRMPASALALPHSTQRAGAFRDEEFGTRHEPTRLPHVARLLALEDRARHEAEASAKSKRKEASAKAPDSAQMIYEFQTVKAGSRWWGGMHLEDLTPAELVAFRAGLSHACEGRHEDGGVVFRLGAKGSVGWGRVSMRFSGALRRVVDAPEYEASDAMLPVVAGPHGATDHPDLAGYVAGLRARREEILAALSEVA